MITTHYKRVAFVNYRAWIEEYSTKFKKNVSISIVAKKK
jgi:hypothetical protein